MDKAKAVEKWKCKGNCPFKCLIKIYIKSICLYLLIKECILNLYLLTAVLFFAKPLLMD